MEVEALVIHSTENGKKYLVGGTQRMTLTSGLIKQL